MKKLLLIILLGFLSGVAHATFQEFYMVTTGSDTNAGATTSTTAFATSTNGNWGGSGTLGRFTAASGTPFSAVVKGQMASVYLDAAASAVFVSSVIAVNGGGASIDVDTTTIKWGTAPSTATTGRSCKIDGAWASLAIATSLFPSGTAPMSTRVNVKAGTYANTSTGRTFGMNGSATVLIWWRGYQTTPGDEETDFTAVAGTNIPLWTFTTGQLGISGTDNIFSSLDITSQCVTANGAAIISSGGSRSQLYNVRITNTAANSNARALTMNASANRATACYFKATTTANVCVNLLSAPQALIGCVVTGGVAGVLVSASTSLIDFSVIDSPAGDAIQFASGVSGYVINTSIYNATGHGINATGTLGTLYVFHNNYLDTVNQASKSGINNASGANSDLLHCVANTYFNCTSNTSGITESFLIFDNGTIASSGFVNPTSQNFSLNPVAKALGYPGKFQNISAYQGYLDPGAVQRQEKGFQGVFVQ